MEIFSRPCVKENILERKPINSRMSHNLGCILLFNVMLSSNKYSCIATFQKKVESMQNHEFDSYN